MSSCFSTFCWKDSPIFIDLPLFFVKDHLAVRVRVSFWALYLFRWSVCLFSHQGHTVLIPAALRQVSKLVPVLQFFFLILCGLFWVCSSFKILWDCEIWILQLYFCDKWKYIWLLIKVLCTHSLKLSTCRLLVFPILRLLDIQLALDFVLFFPLGVIMCTMLVFCFTKLVL